MNHRRFASGMVLLLLAAAPTLMADEFDPSTRSYESTWDPDPGEHHLRLGETSAAFSDLKGRMILQYAGIMPPETEWSDPDTRMYRVVNAAEFFRLNRNIRNMYFPCRKPPKWLGVAPEPSAAGKNPEGFIRVSLLEVDDYRKFLGSKPGLCMDAPYRFSRKTTAR